MTLSTGRHKSQQKKTWKVYKGSFYRPVPWTWNLHSFTYGVLSLPSPTMWYLVWGTQIARGSIVSWTSVIPLWVTESWIIVGEVRGNQYSHAFGFWRPFNYHPLWCGELCYHTQIHVWRLVFQWHCWLGCLQVFGCLLLKGKAYVSSWLFFFFYFLAMWLVTYPTVHFCPGVLPHPRCPTQMYNNGTNLSLTKVSTAGNHNISLYSWLTSWTVFTLATIMNFHRLKEGVSFARFPRLFVSHQS